MEFHKKLQELRKQKGMTQEELASLLFVSRTAVSKWESGRGYPSIDSLRAIARVFSLTVDDLLSTDEILTIAKEEQKRGEGTLQDLVFGALDLCALLLLFLPLFATRVEGAVRAASLLSLDGVAPYLKAVYYGIVILSAFSGALLLAFQGCTAVAWAKSKTAVSLFLGVISACLFIISSQPYAAIFAFSLFLVKVLLLLRRR